MRLPARALVALVLALVAISSAPAFAQTYDPSYPVCMQLYGGANSSGYISCSFTTMEQCRASASGRPATCTVNPFFAQAAKTTQGWRR